MASQAHLGYSVVNDLLVCKFFEVTYYLYSKASFFSCQGQLHQKPCVLMIFYNFLRLKALTSIIFLVSTMML